MWEKYWFRHKEKRSNEIDMLWNNNEQIRLFEYIWMSVHAYHVSCVSCIAHRKSGFFGHKTIYLLFDICLYAWMHACMLASPNVCQRVPSSFFIIAFHFDYFFWRRLSARVCECVSQTNILVHIEHYKNMFNKNTDDVGILISAVDHWKECWTCWQQHFNSMCIWNAQIMCVCVLLFALYKCFVVKKKLFSIHHLFAVQHQIYYSNNTRAYINQIMQNFEIMQLNAYHHNG